MVKKKKNILTSYPDQFIGRLFGSRVNGFKKVPANRRQLLGILKHCSFVMPLRSDVTFQLMEQGGI